MGDCPDCDCDCDFDCDCECPDCNCDCGCVDNIAGCINFFTTNCKDCFNKTGEVAQGAGQLAGNVAQGAGQLAGNVAQGAGQLAGEAGKGVGELASNAGKGIGELASNAPKLIEMVRDGVEKLSAAVTNFTAPEFDISDLSQVSTIEILEGLNIEGVNLEEINNFEIEPADLETASTEIAGQLEGIDATTITETMGNLTADLPTDLTSITNEIQGIDTAELANTILKRIENIKDSDLAKTLQEGIEKTQNELTKIAGKIEEISNSDLADDAKSAMLEGLKTTRDSLTAAMEKTGEILQKGAEAMFTPIGHTHTRSRYGGYRLRPVTPFSIGLDILDYHLHYGYYNRGYGIGNKIIEQKNNDKNQPIAIPCDKTGLIHIYGAHPIRQKLQKQTEEINNRVNKIIEKIQGNPTLIVIKEKNCYYDDTGKYSPPVIPKINIESIPKLKDNIKTKIKKIPWLISNLMENDTVSELTTLAIKLWLKGQNDDQKHKINIELNKFLLPVLTNNAYQIKIATPDDKNPIHSLLPDFSSDLDQKVVDEYKKTHTGWGTDAVVNFMLQKTLASVISEDINFYTWDFIMAGYIRNMLNCPECTYENTKNNIKTCDMILLNTLDTIIEVDKMMKKSETKYKNIFPFLYKDKQKNEFWKKLRKDKKFATLLEEDYKKDFDIMKAIKAIPKSMGYTKTHEEISKYVDELRVGGNKKWNGWRWRNKSASEIEQEKNLIKLFDIFDDAPEIFLSRMSEQHTERPMPFQHSRWKGWHKKAEGMPYEWMAKRSPAKLKTFEGFENKSNKKLWKQCIKLGFDAVKSKPEINQYNENLQKARGNRQDTSGINVNIKSNYKTYDGMDYNQYPMDWILDLVFNGPEDNELWCDGENIGDDGPRKKLIDRLVQVYRIMSERGCRHSDGFVDWMFWQPAHVRKWVFRRICSFLSLGQTKTASYGFWEILNIAEDRPDKGKNKIKKYKDKLNYFYPTEENLKLANKNKSSEVKKITNNNLYGKLSEFEDEVLYAKPELPVQEAEVELDWWGDVKEKEIPNIKLKF